MTTLLTLATRLADPGDGHNNMMWDNNGGMWLWGTITLVVVAAIGIAVWLIMRGTRQPDTPTPNQAREILDERLARGELSTDEYQERLKLLH
jgi:putative membrane protein